MSKKALLVIGIGAFIIIAITLVVVVLVLSVGSFESDEDANVVETEKVNALKDVNLYIAQYFADNAKYPTTLSFDGDNLVLDEVYFPFKKANLLKKDICYRLDGQTTYALSIEVSKDNWVDLGVIECRN